MKLENAEIIITVDTDKKFAFVVKADKVQDKPEEPLIPIEIRNISWGHNQNLKVQFHSTELYRATLSFGLVNTTGTVYQTFDPTPGNTLEFQDSSGRPNGKYKIELTGPDGKHTVASGEFEITDAPKDPVDPVEPPASGEVGLIGKTDTRFMEIKIEETKDGFLVSDVCTHEPRSGYEFWWKFNGLSVEETIKGAKLDKYLWKGTGTLTVIKNEYKIGLDTEARWVQDSGWFDPSAGVQHSFNPGTPTVGGESIHVLTRDETIFPGYKMSHAQSWCFDAPDMKLPAGKAMTFHSIPKEQFQDAAARKRKGETHQNGWGELFEGLPASENADHTVGMHHFQITGPTSETGQYIGSHEALENAGYHYGNLAGITAYETAEGRCWIPFDSDYMRSLLKGRKRKLEEQGLWKDGFHTNVYGGVDFGGLSLSQWGVNNRDEFERLFSMSRDELLSQNRMGGLKHADFMTASNHKWYGHAAADAHVYYSKMFEMMIARRIGLKPMLYPGNLVEVLVGQGYSSGYNFETKTPDGKIFVTTHLARQPWNDCYNMGFLSMFIGDGFYLWDAGSGEGRDSKYPDFWANANHFTTYSKTGDAPVNVPEGVGKYPAIPMYVYDALYSGAYRFNQFNETEGGEIKFVSFKVNGKETKATGKPVDLFDAYKEKRGLAMVREKNGNRMAVYINPWGKNEYQTIEIEGFKSFKSFGNVLKATKERN